MLYEIQILGTNSGPCGSVNIPPGVMGSKGALVGSCALYRTEGERRRSIRACIVVEIHWRAGWMIMNLLTLISLIYPWCLD
jgi:hypothetical protein